MARPARTVEEQERQMIGYATKLAEQQLRDGTASSAVITHYLKLGSTRASLEVEKLRRENDLLRAKASAIDNAENAAQKYQEAIDAFRRYSGHGGSQSSDDQYEEL